MWTETIYVTNCMDMWTEPGVTEHKLYIILIKSGSSQPKVKIREVQLTG